MAETYTEAHRYMGLRAVRDTLLASSHATPESIPEQYRALVRTNEPIKGVPNMTQAMALSTKAVDDITPHEASLAGKMYEGIRRHVFPTAEDAAKNLPEEDRGKLFGTSEGGFKPVPGYRWVDKRLLGGLDRTNPLWGAFENPILRKGLRAVDAINAAQKAQILYLKPSYVFPNLMGNVFLSLVHQGFLAPWNLARSAKMFQKMQPDTVAAIKSLTSEGLVESGLRDTSGIASKITGTGQKLASRYGKIIDDPLRFAAFTHEAGVSGFHSAEDIDALMREPRFAQERRNISARTNEAMINYERLSPGEEAIARRLIFFYPWVKGSTRYAAYFAKNHPTLTGLQAPVGNMGQQSILHYLGEVPQFAEGLIPFGGKNPNMPLVSNPAAATVLSEPADIAEMAQSLLHGGTDQSSPFTQLAPLESALVTLGSGGNLSTVKYPASMSPLEESLHQLTGGSPFASLYNQLMGRARSGAPPSKSLYPSTSKLDAIMRFALVGSPYPTVYNKAIGEKKARQEHTVTGFRGGGL
jgi:hypothetical protein